MAIVNEVQASGASSSKLLSLADSMSSHLVRSRSDATTKKYYASFKRWEGFITAEGGQAIPAEPIRVALYLTSLVNGGKSPGVFQSATCAIKNGF